MSRRLPLRSARVVLPVVIVGLVISVLSAKATPTASSASWQKMNLNAGPEGRLEGSAGYDPQSHQMLLFGGQSEGGSTEFNDLWSLLLEPGNESWTEIKPSGAVPSPRFGAALAVDAPSRRLVMFGGFSAGASTAVGFQDTWVLDLTAGTKSWSKVASGGPDKRYGASLVWIPPVEGRTIGRMVLFGGAMPNKYFNDTWVLDLAPGAEKWTKLSAAGTLPSASYYHAAAYDPRANRMIVFGGLSDGYFHKFAHPGPEPWGPGVGRRC